MLPISRGVGRSDLIAPEPASVVVSSRMMSLQRSMHSSQMNTDGPAISFLTSCWLLPQNEQYRSFSLEPFWSDIFLLRLPGRVAYGCSARLTKILSINPYFTASSADM